MPQFNCTKPGCSKRSRIPRSPDSVLPTDPNYSNGYCSICRKGVSVNKKKCAVEDCELLTSCTYCRAHAIKQKLVPCAIKGCHRMCKPTPKPSHIAAIRAYYKNMFGEKAEPPEEAFTNVCFLHNEARAEKCREYARASQKQFEKIRSDMEAVSATYELYMQKILTPPDLADANRDLSQLV